jgi:RNase adaptor protein for sRNA GlmZ degradation
VGDALSYVDQKTQGLRKKLIEKIHETQVDLQAVKISLDMRRRSLQETLADTKNDLHEEAWTLKVEIRISQETMETKIKAPDASSIHS